MAFVDAFEVGFTALSSQCVDRRRMSATADDRASAFPDVQVRSEQRRLWDDKLSQTRGLPKANTTDNGKEFCSWAMLTWAHACGVQLFLIEPSKPNQNAYVESFNGRFCY